VWILFQLWVSPRSHALKEKEYFDMNLAPFYRIEQVQCVYTLNLANLMKVVRNATLLPVFISNVVLYLIIFFLV
jgi:hypothetical protein